ncbi:MAG: hypothetical protein HY867_08920 [Chloroflexi bacterium]|nr:hypothetical protein [Chloroflexota bacterium]
MRAPIEFENPSLRQDRFVGKFSRGFWKMRVGNRTGKTMRLASSDATLIGRYAFRPTPTEDVILTFTSRVRGDFHGSAGAAFQLENTFGPDGSLKKPIDKFGITIQGRESNSQKAGSVTCFLTLGGIPVEVKEIEADVSMWHEYGIRLRWINRTNWHGSVSVDGKEVCNMPLPAFGPVEVKVWMENDSAMTRLRRWWEIAPFMNIEPRNNRSSLFEMQSIKLYAEAR